MRGSKNDQQIQMEKVEPDWRQVFGRFDLDGDGSVPLLEFRRYLSDSDRRSQVPQSVIDEILARADRDMDGCINYTEFIQMIDGRNMSPRGRTFIRRMMLNAAYSLVPKSKRHRRYVDQYSCCPPPIFILLVSLVELVLFIMDGVRLGGVTASGPVDTESILMYSPYRRAEVWRLFTYMFVHVGFVHISTNLLVQLVVGVPLEMVHRWWRVGVIYMCGVAAGSLATSVFDPEVYLAGASGGVYAILTAHMADLMVNWAEMEFAVVRLLFLLLLGCTDVGVAIYNRYMVDSTNKIGYVAHLAGAIAGVLIGNVVLRNLRVRRWERVLWWFSLILFLVLLAAGVIINSAAPSHFPPQEI